MTMPLNTQQLKIRLEIIPEDAGNKWDRALVNEVCNEIFEYLTVQGYYIEPVDTGTLDAGHDFWVAVLTYTAANIASGSLNEVGTQIADKIGAVFKHIQNKLKTSKQKSIPTTTTLTLPDGKDIKDEESVVSVINQLFKAAQDNHQTITSIETITNSLTVRVQLGPPTHNHP